MLSAAYEEILSELLAEGVRFLVIGGYAMAALGLPRFTRDLDLWVWSESQNIKKLYKALGNAGVLLEGINEQDLLEVYNFLEIGAEPLKIDIIANLGDASFEQAWRSRFHVESGDVDIPFIGINEFVQIKRLAGRVSDLQDIDRLIAMGIYRPAANDGD
jgi:predicted nucleotidyltransferase